jgi:putative membrane protein
VKTASLLLALLGLGLGTALIGWFGFARVVEAATSIGWGGFALMSACQIVLFGVLGLAWNAIMPRGGLLRLITWGRMVRDAVANCLPFSVLGGIVAGAQSLTTGGISWPLALGSSVVDVTAEFLGEIGFIALGLVLLLLRAPDSDLALPAAAVLAIAILAGATFVWLQHGAGRIFRALGTRIAGDRLDRASAGVDLLESEMIRLYRRSARLALGATIHFVGWIGTGCAGWVAYRLLGADIDFASVLIIEALLQVLMTVAFLVPAAIGVQEAGYASLGLAFGVPPDLSLGVSLVRRARDLALGVPILLVWQLTAARHTVRQPLAGRAADRNGR